MKRLSNTPSVLINEAIEDLCKIELNVNYIIDMSVWHEPRPRFSMLDNAVCTVCFGGAVMANSLDADINNTITPYCFDDDTTSKLNALDCFRKGDIKGGLESCGIPDNEIENFYLITAHTYFSGDYNQVSIYSDDKEGFKQDMLNLAKALQDFGL